MKKNININLFGTLYNIDEDAYNLLENYLNSMQRYFNRQEGGEEVADDIEHRVAELLWKKREAGMTAVDINVVKEIIDTIGSAEDIAGESRTSRMEPSRRTSNSSPRRRSVSLATLTTEVANTSAHTATIAVPTTRSWAAFALVWQLTSKRAAHSSGDLEQLPSRYSASVCLPLFTSSCGSSHLPPLHPKTVCVNKVGTLRPTTWQNK